MASITGLLCQIITGNFSGAGTDGHVYLGIGGREFSLDSDADDYEKNSWREYILGLAPNEPELTFPQIRVKNKDLNDPRNGFELDTTNLNKAPVYLRFEPTGADDNWNLKSLVVVVYKGSGSFHSAYVLPSGFNNLWMGKSFGNVVYLTEVAANGDNEILEIGRKIAKEEKIEEIDPNMIFQPGPFIM
ncbi:MAG: hypothetical protein ABIR66_05875 [Saprospiraceae bacterium]